VARCLIEEELRCEVEVGAEVLGGKGAEGLGLSAEESGGEGS
jgi:hypothetical protein